MKLVLDGTVALAWCFEDEARGAALELANRVAMNGALVPAFWRLEIANGLRAAVKRGHLDVDRRNAMLAALGNLPIRADEETFSRAWGRSLQLSDRFDLAPYEASYLELALRAGSPLATLDPDLASAARAASIELVL